MTVGLPVVAEALHLGERGQSLHLGIDRKAERAQVIEGVVMAREGRRPLRLSELVGPERKLA